MSLHEEKAEGPAPPGVPSSFSKSPAPPSSSPASFSSSWTPSTVPSLLPARSRADSSFHRVATLYCPSCRYLEFPGCLLHNGLLCTQKGNGFMSCTGCEEERKRQGGEDNDSMLSMVCATDLSEPWSVACQHCNLVRADTVPWVLEDAQSLALAAAIERETADVTATLVIQCEECKTTVFPIRHQYLAHNDGGRLRGRRDEQSLADDTVLLSVADFPFAHYRASCSGALVLQPILMSKLEGKFCGQSLPSSPCLPKDASLVSGFIPPLSWVTGKAAEEKRDEEKARNETYLLSALQEKEWRAPVWRDRSYVGEFGDVFVRDTELEGGMLAPSIAALELVARRVAERRRATWLKEWSDADVARLVTVVDVLKAGTEVAMLAKASLLAMNDKDVDDAGKKAKVLAVQLRFHDLLHALPPGGTLIIPGGWIAPKGGHGIMHAILHHADGSYSFTVSNTGGGLPYHPAQTGTPKTRFLCTLRFDGIARHRMLDDGFWLLFWRLQLVSSDDHDHHTIYDVLIPHLTGGTVAATLSTTDDACEYRTPQRAGNCYYKSVLECFRYLMRRAGLTRAQAKQVAFCVRREYVEMTWEDLVCLSAFRSKFRATSTPLHDPSDLPMLRLGTRQMCYAAIKESRQGRLSGDDLQDVMRLVERIEEKVASMQFEVDYGSKLIPQLRFDGTREEEDTAAAAALSFPGFECFHRNSPADRAAVLALAGAEVEANEAAEVNYAALSRTTARTLDECMAALDAAVTLCGTTSAADTLNTYFHRITYIHQLTSAVLPVPLPRHREAECAWLSRPLQFAEQQHVLHALLRLARQYVTSVFSIDFPAHFSLNHRVITMAAVVTMADRVLRTQPADTPNPVTSTYVGLHDADAVYGPSLVNGADIPLATLTSQQECYDPAIAITRGRVLEYFSDLERVVKRKIFAYPNSAHHQTAQYSSDDPTLQWTRDVCAAAGYVIDKRGPGGKELSEVESVARWLYTDEDGLYGISHAKQLPALAKEHPEFGQFRDVLFLFKLAMVPMRTTCRVVAAQRWREQDARMYWSWQGMPMSNGMVFVFAKAFDRKDILAIQSRRVRSPASPVTYISLPQQSAAGAFGFFNIPGLTMPAAPAPSSGAGVSEEDVIHCATLPLFDHLLTLEASEALMSTLTVPYLRIPLLLAFFANKDRVDLLHHHKLQRLFSAALFEPGTWSRADDHDPLSSVPAIAGRLGSCYGLLLNEMIHSPTSLLAPLIMLLQFALELDTGSFGTASSSLLLFLSTVAMRVEGYVRAAVALVEGKEVRCSAINLQQLHDHHAALIDVMQAQLLPTLSSYRAQAAADIPQAVLLHSHIALLAQSALSQPHTDARAAFSALSTFLGALSFVMTWHSSGVGIGKQARDEEEMSEEADQSSGLDGLLAGGGNVLANIASSLSSSMEKNKVKKAKLDELRAITDPKPAIPELDVFSAIQRARPAIIDWLSDPRTSEQSVNALLHSVVQYVHGHEALSPRSPSSRTTGGWRAIGSVMGRYVSPDGSVEVNVQTGAVYSHEQHIHPVSDEIVRSEDFQLVFGRSPHHLSVLHRYEAMSHFAMFGLPYTLQWWAAQDKYEELVGLPRVVPEDMGELSDANYRHGTAVTTGGDWRCAGSALQECKRENPGHAERCAACGAHKPMLSEVEKRGVLYAGRTYTRRYGSTPLPASESWVVDLLEEILYEQYGEKRESFNYSLFLPTDVVPDASDTAVLLGLDGHTWKQVVCYRHARLCQVYLFHPHGRTVYRSLIYTSNARLSLRALKPGTKDRWKPWGRFCRYQAGNMDEIVPERDTLVIARTSGRGEQQLYVPSTLLYGVVAQVLLDSFLFWQVQGQEGRGGYLVGQPREGAAWQFGLKVNMTEREQGVVEEKGEDAQARWAKERWDATVRQAVVDEDGDLEEVKEEEPGVYLVNLLASSSDDRLHRLVQVLTRIEDISHILVWSSSPPGAPSLVLTKVELPRLKLSFHPRRDVYSDTVRLYSSDHAGFFLTDVRDDALVALLAPLPYSVLLENERHELRVLAINCPMHRPKVYSCPFTTELVAERSAADWLSSVKTAYYVYTVHISHTFLLAETLSSSLFLLILYLLARSYSMATRLAETCEIDAALSAEEAYVMRMMERTTHDQHPDAHACRLKVALAVSYSEERLVLKDEQGKAWELDKEYAQYIKKVAHVSAASRLSLEEELQLVELCRDDKGRIDDHDVENRATYLHLLPSPYLTPSSASQSSPSTPLSSSPPTAVVLTPQKREGLTNPWFDFERTVQPFLQPGWKAGVWHGIVAYKRPDADALTGSALMETVSDAMNDTMVGSQHKLGFLFLYDLLTGEVSARLSPAHPDCSFTLGKLLATMAYTKVTHNGEKVKPGPHYLPYAVAAVLSSYFFPTPNNPARVAISVPAERFPPLPSLPYSDSPDAFQRGYILNRTTNPVGAFLQSLANYFQGFTQFSPEWQASRQRPAAPAVGGEKTVLEAKAWRLARPWDTACAERVMAPFELFDECGLGREDYEALVGSPLAPLGLSAVLEVREKTETPLTSLPFDLSSHPSSSSYVAQQMLARMAADMRAYHTQIQEAKDSELSGVRHHDWTAVSQTLRSLTDAMRAMRERDARYVRTGQSIVQALANYVPGTASPMHGRIEGVLGADATAASDEKKARYEYLMARYSGQALLMTMEFLTAALLSSKAEADLRLLNPFLSDRLAGLVLTLSASILLHANRLGLIDRCMADCIQALSLIRRVASTKDNDPSLITSIVIQTRTLVDGLTAHRHYTRPMPSAQAPAPSAFDPRFLVFEYIFNILLRPMQVTLVNDFVRAVRRGQSQVQQMLMGAGKTTVVGPLLALILADGDRLVMQVVPSALLPMSRAVLRSRFTALLPKRILTLEFDRGWKDDPRLIAKLYHKLEMARRNKGVVIATAVSVKSVFLKYVELLHQLDVADYASLSAAEEKALEMRSAVADGLSRVLGIFQRGVLIMDEVDLLLHPLRSELNFPIGARLPLEPAPERWQLAIHLIDALFYQQTRYLSLSALHDVPEAGHVLGEVHAAIERGKAQHMMQASPHLLLLNDAFYHTDVKPLLARWCVLFLRAKGIGAGTHLPTAGLVAYLCSGWSSDPVLSASIKAAINSHQMQLLNLSHDWLNNFLPHVLHKVDRVSYGLLTADDLRSFSSTGSALSHTRALVAVPFVAKDVPSRSSEFSHPDVLIGLTVLAFRIEGLRKSDVLHIITSLKSAVAEEMGPEHLRPSSVLFDRWLREAHRQRAHAVKAATSSSSPLAAALMHRQESADAEAVLAGRLKILPLSKFQLSDAAQVHALFLLLHRLPSLQLHYLSSYIFPTCMVSQVFNLSASGQELGGSMLFSRRIGFSGTVSSLVPLELGECGYEKGADGKVLNVLTSGEVVTWSLKERWTVLGLLDDIAAAASSPTTRFHSLIDTGALITGLENHQVAAYLLSRGLAGFDGVVYLNRHDDAMILLRSAGAAIPLSQSGVALERRFSFYDQVHTTGIDLKHPLDCTAVLTLGKDMTFRDYAQGAFRMRQIGVGQRVHLFIIPEVAKLIQRELRLLDGWEAHMVVHVAAWLTTNSMRMEKLQFYQLCWQDLHNVWRKRAFHTLLADTTNPSSHPSSLPRHRRLRAPQLLPPASPELQGYSGYLARLSLSLNLFRREVDFSVAADVPVEAPFFGLLVAAVAEHVGLGLVQDADEAVSIGQVLEMALMAEGGEGAGDDRPSFDREMVNEQEREQEKEKEKEVLRDPRASRDDEQHAVWKIEQLGQALPFTTDAGRAHYAKTVNVHPFYALSSLRLAECRDDHLVLPPSLLVSHNYYKQSWAINPVAHRRLKNVLVVMEWQLGDLAGDAAQSVAAVGKEGEEGWRRIFSMFLSDGEAVVKGAGVQQLHRVLGVLASPALASLDFESFLALTQRAESSRQLPTGVVPASSVSADGQRFYVVLPLVEAETLRRSIHTDQRVFASVDRGGVSIGLWTLDGQLVDYTPRFRPASDVEHERAFQALRFLNNELFFTTHELTSLLHAVAGTPLSSRRTFFARALSCRHRERRTFENTPVVTAMQLPDHLTFIRLQALASLLCSGLTEKGYTVLEAFSLVDADGDGYVTVGEMYSALTWLGLDVSGEEVRGLVRRADLDGNGQLDFAEFAGLFHQHEQDSRLELQRRTSLSLSLKRTLSSELRSIEDAEENWSSDPPPALAADTARSAKELPAIPQLPLPAAVGSDAQGPSRMPVVYDGIATAAASTSSASNAGTGSGGGRTTAAAAPLSGAGWQCAACTFLNATSASSCGMCGTARPPLSGTAGVAVPQNPFAALFGGASNAQWTCTVCTLSNPGTASSCQACGTPRR